MQFLIGRLQLFVAGRQFFIGRLQFLVGGFHLFDGRLQIILTVPKIGFELLDAFAGQPPQIDVFAGGRLGGHLVGFERD